MEIKEYALLVAEMRKAQKRYYKTRLQEALIEAKQLEKKVDLETELIRYGKVSELRIRELFS